MEPNPHCILCDEQACVFHAATTVVELGGAFIETVKQNAANGVANIFAAGFAKMESSLPDDVRALMARLQTRSLEKRFEELLDQDAFAPDDLRELASVTLALAVIQEERSLHGPAKNDPNRNTKRRA